MTLTVEKGEAWSLLSRLLGVVCAVHHGKKCICVFKQLVAVEVVSMSRHNVDTLVRLVCHAVDMRRTETGLMCWGPNPALCSWVSSVMLH